MRDDARAVETAGRLSGTVSADPRPPSIYSLSNLTFRDLEDALGPAIVEGTPDWEETLTLTRTDTGPESHIARTITKRITRPGMVQVELLEPGRSGMRHEDGRVWLRGTGTLWTEAIPMIPGPGLAGATLATPATPPVIRRLHGDRELEVEFAPRDGYVLTWRVDWVRKVITGKRLVDPSGAMVWEEAWRETHANGWRWLLRRRRTVRCVGGTDFDERYEWNPSPEQLAAQGRGPR